MQTLEVCSRLIRKGFDGVVYFDTFPDVSGCGPIGMEDDIAIVDSLWKLAKELKARPDLAKAIECQSTISSQDIVRRNHLWPNRHSDSGDRLGRPKARQAGDLGCRARGRLL